MKELSKTQSPEIPVSTYCLSETASAFASSSPTPETLESIPVKVCSRHNREMEVQLTDGGFIQHCPWCETGE